MLGISLVWMGESGKYVQNFGRGTTNVDCQKTKKEEIWDLRMENVNWVELAQNQVQ
jgi:hypothetical protein